MPVVAGVEWPRALLMSKRSAPPGRGCGGEGVPQAVEGEGGISAGRMTWALALSAKNSSRAFRVVERVWKVRYCRCRRPSYAFSRSM